MAMVRPREVRLALAHGHLPPNFLGWTPILRKGVVKMAVTSPHTLTCTGGSDLSSTLTEEYVTIAMATIHSFLGRVGLMVTLLPFPEGK